MEEYTIIYNQSNQLRNVVGTVADSCSLTVMDTLTEDEKKAIIKSVNATLEDVRSQTVILQQYIDAIMR